MPRTTITIRGSARRRLVLSPLLLLNLALALGESPLLRDGDQASDSVGGSRIAGTLKGQNANARCSLHHQCEAPTIDWDSGSENAGAAFNYEVTIALNLVASAPASITKSPSSFDESNFAAIDARLHLQFCGSNFPNDRKESTAETLTALRVYRARLEQVRHRCNDRAGIIESNSDIAGDNTKFALLNKICSAHYPIFQWGPSDNWFAVAISGARVLGVDFPADKITSENKAYLQADQNFKRAVVFKLLNPPRSTCCLPRKSRKEDCIRSNLDRSNSLLVTEKNSDGMNSSTLTGSVQEAAAAMHLKENLRHEISSSFEILPGGKLNHALVLESASFQSLPTSLDSPSLLAEKVKVESRWDLFRIDDIHVDLDASRVNSPVDDCYGRSEGSKSPIVEKLKNIRQHDPLQSYGRGRRSRLRPFLGPPRPE